MLRLTTEPDSEPLTSRLSSAGTASSEPGPTGAAGLAGALGPDGRIAPGAGSAAAVGSRSLAGSAGTAGGSGSAAGAVPRGGATLGVARATRRPGRGGSRRTGSLGRITGRLIE